MNEYIKQLEALYIRRVITLKELTKALNLLHSNSVIASAFINILKTKGLKEGKK